jgi:hypothetical protein
MGNKSYSKGISWFDDCRIPFVDDKDKGSVLDPITGIKGYKHTAGAMTGGIPRMDSGNPIGRFPANLLVSDDMLNDGVIKEGNKPYIRNKNHRYSMDYGLKVYEGMNTIGYADTGTNSRYYNIDKWFDNIISE